MNIATSAARLAALRTGLFAAALVLAGAGMPGCASLLDRMPWGGASAARLDRDAERLERMTTLTIELRTLYVAAAHGAYNSADRRNFRRTHSILSAALQRLCQCAPDAPCGPPTAGSTEVAAPALGQAEATAGIAAMDALLEELIAARVRIQAERLVLQNQAP
jgi:hypothetical protein